MVADQGGAVEAVAYMKARLVESHRERIARIERGEIKVIGQNCFTETEDSPLTAGADGGILTPDPQVERERREALEAWKAERDDGHGRSARSPSSPRRPPTSHATSCRRRSPPRRRARQPASGRGTLREVFGDYRAPTGVSGAAAGGDEDLLAAVRERVDELAERIGHRPRILVGKPGLDGHSNGAEQIAVRARDVGMEVIYQGIRLTPRRSPPRRSRRTSTWSGSRSSPARTSSWSPRPSACLREQEVDVPVVVGGIIPAADAERLREAGVARGLHAEGLRRQPDHGRDRRSRRPAQRDRLDGSRLTDAPRHR